MITIAGGILLAVAVLALLPWVLHILLVLFLVAIAFGAALFFPASLPDSAALLVFAVVVGVPAVILIDGVIGAILRRRAGLKVFLKAPSPYRAADR
jgi:hypothetical protein